jgi:hypothetical protein
MILGCLKVIKRIKTFFVSLCKNNGYKITCKTISPYGNQLRWSALIPRDTLVLEGLEYQNFSDYNLKYRVFYPGELYVKSSMNTCIELLHIRPKVPWLWIGGDDFFGSSIDMSDVLSHYILSGNLIKLELLKNLEPKIEKWQYMDPETLELFKFPDEGIQIKG